MTMKVYEHEDDEGCDDSYAAAGSLFWLVFNALAGVAVWGAICIGVGYVYSVTIGAAAIDAHRTRAAKVGSAEGSDRGADNGRVKIR